nr:hypothetical protein [Tanacetum cinerariifolium]
MYKDTLKDSGAGADKSAKELQVEVELQRLNNHTLEEDQTDNKDQTDQDDGDDEDAGIKKGIEGVQKPRYKARLVARGFTQRAAQCKDCILHGNLEEMIYMRQPPRYEQDYMLIACKSKAEIGSTNSLLKREFDMKDLREPARA